MTARQFNRLTPPRRRVAIAQDVLATLDLPKRKRYTVARGRYCVAVLNQPLFRDSSRQLQELLPTFERKCSVCGIGALFISHVRLANAVTVGEVNSLEYDYRDREPDDLLPVSESTGVLDADDDNIVAVMSDYFTESQLRTIEAAFEGGYIDGSYAANEETVKQCAAWLHRYPLPSKRLRAICRNIVRNKGEFVPADLPARAREG